MSTVSSAQIPRFAAVWMMDTPKGPGKASGKSVRAVAVQGICGAASVIILGPVLIPLHLFQRVDRDHAFADGDVRDLFAAEGDHPGAAAVRTVDDFQQVAAAEIMHRLDTAHGRAVEGLDFHAEKVGMIEFIVFEFRQGFAPDVEFGPAGGLGLFAGEVFLEGNDKDVLGPAMTGRGEQGLAGLVEPLLTTNRNLGAIVKVAEGRS